MPVRESAEAWELKLDAHFLEHLAGLEGIHWESLASVLSLTSTEIEEVKRRSEGSQSQRDPALLILKMWATRDDATYGQLCQKLKTIALFQYGKN